MDRTSLIFCASALAASLLIAALAFPFAALSESKIARAKSIVPATSLGALDLGAYGKVTVSDMLSYYTENPPEETSAASTKRKVRFEGC